MKILVVENSPEGTSPWWLAQLPALPANVTLELAHVRESGRSPLSLAWEMFRLLSRARQFDVVITMQDSRTTFFLGCMKRLLPGSGYKHIIQEFITRERDDTLYSKIKYRFLRFALSKAAAIHCSARSEHEYYRRLLHLPRERFRYIPLSTHPKFLTWPAAPASPVIVSAGRTGRDYGSLLEAAAGLDARIQIIADPKNLAGLHVPQNVELAFNLPQDELANRMSASSFVVIPLQNRHISVGQSVILIAMALGKAVITSRVPAVTDYVKDGQTALLVPPEDPRALRQAMEHLLAQPHLATELGAAAKLRVADRFVPSRCAPYICASARSVCDARS